MDFSLSEEQQLLKDSVQRFVRDEYALEARRKLVASDIGYSEDNWAKMAELGWLAMPLPEEFGGIGGGAVETMVLMEEFGRGLVVEPYMSSIVMGGGFLVAGGSKEQKTELLPKLAAGERTRSCAGCSLRPCRSNGVGISPSGGSSRTSTRSTTALQ